MSIQTADAPDGLDSAFALKSIESLDPDVECVIVGFLPRFDFYIVVHAANYLQREGSILLVMMTFWPLGLSKNPSTPNYVHPGH